MNRPSLTTTDCLLCGSSAHTVIKTFADGVAVVRCANCGLMYASPRHEDPTTLLTRASVDSLRERYAPILQGQAGYYRRPIFEHYLRLIGRYAPGRRMLDVGSAQGFFPALAREHGWDVAAVEPSAPMAAFAREALGLDVREGTLASADLSGLTRDAVTFTDSLEYVPDPLGALAQVRSLLGDNGIVLLKVPNGSYFEFWHGLERRAGRRLGNEEPFSPSERVAHYTRTTLRRLMETSGFEVLHDESPPPIDSPLGGSELEAPWNVGLAQRLARRALRAAGRAERRLTGRDNFGQSVLMIGRKHERASAP